MGLEESATYQAILAEGWPESWVEEWAKDWAEGWAEGWAKGWAEGWAKGWAEGRIEEGTRILLLLGRECFGEPSSEMVATIEAIDDVTRIELLVVRLLDVSSWDELLSGEE